MSARLTRRRLALGMGAVLVGAVAWLLFAPIQLGGQLSYVVVHGGSMEPGLTDGDVAVVRDADAYGPGDAVAYESHELDRVVLHRIVRSEGGRFVLEGDANDWLDSSKPTESEMLGRLWFSVPAVGTGVGWLGEPLHAAVICGFLVLLCLAGTGATARRRRRRRPGVENPTLLPSSRPEPPPVRADSPSLLLAQVARTGIFLATCAALVFLALGLVAFTRSASHDTTREVGHTHGGAFTYAGGAPTGAVYPGGRVVTGQPVFLRLVDRLDIAFQYELRAESAADLSGRARLVAELTDGSGWRREITLAPATAFSGSSVRISGPLDLRELRALIRRVETATGVPRATYELAVHPEVTLTGRVNGAAVSETFAPRLPFRLDTAELQLAGVASDGATTRGLQPEKAGTTEVSERAVSTLGVGRARMDVPTARRTAIVGGAIALTALLLLVCLELTGPRRAEAARIRAAYGHMLVPLASAPQGVGPTIEVSTIGGLARMAQSAGRPLLDFDDGRGGHTYYVDDGSALYSYESGEVTAADAVPPREAEIPRERLAVVRRATERL